MNNSISIAQRIVESAGPLALRYFRTALAVENKRSDQGFDPVTAADRDIETFIRAELAEHFPGDLIFGEEYGGSLADLENRAWVIDPIDGTRAFISGQLGWGILLGLCDGGRPRLGVMHQSYTGETFSGDGEQATLTRQGGVTPLSTSKQVVLNDSIVCTTDPTMFPDHAGFSRVRAKARLHRFGGDCYNYCLLASGTVDAVVENLLEPYDILPLVPVIEGAGGVVTDQYGNVPLSGGMVVAAATAELHAEILNQLLS